MGIMLKDEIRLSTLRERLEDRPNNRDVIVHLAHLEYYLGLYDDAERSIARALELGHEDDGSLQVRLARIHVRRHKTDSANAQRHLRAALAAFSEALKFVVVASNAVHYLEVTSVYLKLNETQRAANALSTILVRWPHSKEAALAKETCAQTLMTRGQAKDALGFYKALMVDPVPKEQAAPILEGDRAEVDLPVASRILGAESLFLQMGLCFETLSQDKMATEAYRQAWNALLEQRAARQNSRGNGSAFGVGANGGGESSGNEKEGAVLKGVGGGDNDNDDEIGRILQQAKMALTIGGDSSNIGTSGWSRGSTREQKQRNEGTPGKLATGTSLREEDSAALLTPESSIEALWCHRNPGRGGDAVVPSKKEAAAEEARVRAVGFELWSKDPYTWFKLGQDVLEGGCYALALEFLVKAVALLPPGLQQQEKEKHLPVYLRKKRSKPGEALIAVPSQFGLAQLHLNRAEAFFQLGRFSDAHAAAEEARDVDPFGKAVRLLCPRLMALHSEDARSQYSLESLSAVRAQRAWRGHRVVRALRDLVTKQVAALRIQRFMRGWRRRNAELALRLVFAGALELSRLSAPYANGLGVAAQEAASERLQALAASAISVQRAARVLIAHRTVSRRRESITAIQSFYRGHRARWALSAALEEAQNLRLGPRGSGGHGEDSTGEGEGGRTTAMALSLQRGEGSTPRNDLLTGYDGSVRVGSVTRRNVPMDEDCPEGFGPPNLAAFLWESREEAYGPCFGSEGVEPGEAPLAPHSEGEDRRSCCKEEDGNVNVDHYDRAVFELSAKAVVSTASIPEYGGNMYYRAARASSFFGEREGEPPDLNKSFSPVAPAQQQPLPPLWTPVAVAPPEALERALRCSMLIVSSPSFDSACARRLFSRIGRPSSLPSSLQRGHTTTVEPSTTKQPLQKPQPRAEPGGKPGDREGFISALASEKEVGRDQTSWRHPQGASLRHIMVVGESPIGSGGLSELSSALRCRYLPRLTTLIIGGYWCRVGPRGVMSLAVALSSPGCSQLRNLSLSDCCLGGQSWLTRKHRRQQQPQRSAPLDQARAPDDKTMAAAQAAWDCFFRHLQRLQSLSTLSLQRCGLEDRDVRSLSVSLQILPAGRLRCLRLNGNCVGLSGLRMLLTALTSRRMRLPALWLRGQRPAMSESGAKGIVEEAFRDGLYAEVEFERPFEVMGGRSQLVLIERTTEAEDLGSRVRKHPTSQIYI